MIVSKPSTLNWNLNNQINEEEKRRKKQKTGESYSRLLGVTPTLASDEFVVRHIDIHTDSFEKYSDLVRSYKTSKIVTASVNFGVADAPYKQS